MDVFLTQPLERQRVIYDEAGRRLGLSAGSLEKDLWVCWTLRALFRLPSSGPHLTFKGGTSLSKGWKLIDRFSEDIDIVIDREFLGFGGADAPENASSNKQRMKRLEALMLAARHHVRDVLSPALEQEIREGSAAPKARLARHYYDLWCLITRGVAERAVRDGALFDRVAAHRAVFFRRSRDAQASFAPGSLRIVPATERLALWRRDYDAMRESMFFGEVPDFAEILSVVGRFEEDFNSLRHQDTEAKPQS